MEGLTSWIKRLYSPEGFRGPVVTLLSGSALTLLVSYLAVPILTRLFTPEEFGISDYFVMLIAVLSTFSSLRYEDAVMLPDDDRSAGTVFWLSGLLTFGTVVLVGVAAVFSDEITSALRVPGLSPWLWLVAPTLLLIRFSRLSELWLSRKKRFRPITAGEVTNKLSTVGSRIAAGAAAHWGAGGLILGFSAGLLASGVYYLTALRRHARILTRLDVSVGELKAAARRYRRFPAYATPAALLNAVASRLPVILLPIYFTMETVGLFGRAFVALAVPLSVIGGAVSQVFFVHAAEAHRAGRLDALTARVHERLVMLGMFPMILLVFAAPELFAFVFGAEWETAGTLEQYLAVWFFAAGVASPLTRLYDVLERQRAELILSLITFFAVGSALVIGGLSGNVVLTMLMVGLAGAAVRLLHIATMMNLSGVPIRTWIRPYARYLLISLVLVLPVVLTKEYLPLWGTALASAAVGVLYLLVVLREERSK